MITRWLSLFIITLTLCAVSRSFAQESANADRSVGIAASLQNEQLDFVVPIWAGERVVIGPALGVVVAESLGQDIQLGVMGRYYLNTPRIVAPYVGAKLGVMMFLPTNGSSDIDVLAGLMLGGEYFLHPQFSLGVEAQLNVVRSGDNSTRFGNPGKMNINTGSAVFASFYF